MKKSAEVKQPEKQNYVEGEVLVKFKEQKIDLEQSVGRTKARQFAVSKNLDKKEDIRKSNISVLKIKDSKTVEEKIAELKNDSRVEYVQPNFLYYPLAIDTNDTYGGLLWGLDNTGQNVNGVSGIDDADIDAPEAWEMLDGSEDDVIVAVIDDGVAYNHPDLIDNMWDGTNCSGSDKNGNPLSGNCLHGYDYEDNDLDPLPTSGSHGTHIAGTIGAVKNNGMGIIGVAPNVKIMALKVDYSTSQIVKSIDFAEQNGAKVINASWGCYGSGQGGTHAVCGGDHDYRDQAMINAIESFSGLFIVAAGNGDGDTDEDGDDHDNGQTLHFYPCDHTSDNIICVAATDSDDNLADFSDYGINSVDVGAPGVNIYSTVPSLISSTLLNETFEEITPPNTPNEWIKTDYWGTYNLGSVFGNVLYGDLNYPYTNNVDSTITLPTYNLDEASSATIDFWTRCDTEYITTDWHDYMALEISSDGINFDEYVIRWDEAALNSLDDSIPNGDGIIYHFNNLPIPNSCLTNDFKLRFRWHTNTSDGNYDGCWIDDIVINKSVYTDGSDENYDYASGTSMAAPHVAGLAALIWGYKPELSYSDVKNVILTTGDSLDSLAGKTTTGKRINAFKALDSLASSGTEVSGNITEDTTWTLGNSPYIVMGTVQVYATLTIEPGVEVRFNTDAGLTIGGELIAVGTEDQRIIFTSNNDNPSAGNWKEIRFIDTATDALLDDDGNYLSGSIIKHCQIEHAYSAIIAEDSSPYIESNIVRYGKRGIFVNNSSSIIKNNTVYDINHLPLDLSGNLGWGIFSWEGNPTVIDNEIKNCSGGYSGRDGALVMNNVIKDNTIGINGTSIIKQNTITGNNTGIVASGNIISKNIISGNEIGILTGEYKYLQLSVSRNNIFDNLDYNIKVQTSADIDAVNNYWGTTDTTIIDEKIYDYYDDISLGKVNYIPFATAELDFDDQTPPNITGLSNDNTPTQSKTWNWDSDDPAAKFRYAITQIFDWVPVGDYSDIKTATQDTGDGIYWLHVQAIDEVGNESGLTIVSAILDNIPPTAVLSGTPPNPTNQTTTNITVGNAVDTEIVTHYRYSLDGDDYGNETSVNENIQSSGLADGEHTLSVIGRDEAGNWQSEVNPTLYTWTVDTTPPTVEETTPVTTPTSDSTPDVGITVENGASWEIKNGEAVLATGVGTGIEQIVTLLELTEGTYNLTLTAADEAGNTITINLSEFTIDLSASPISLSTLPNDPTKETTADITVSGDDIVVYKYNLDNAGYGEEMSIDTNIILSGLSEGEHTIFVKGRDEAGNWSDEVSETWTVDLTPPNAPLITDPAEAIILNADTYFIAGTAEDNSLVKIYSGAELVGSQQLGIGETAYSIEIDLAQNADNNFTATAIDLAGNESASAAVPIITEDSIAPAVVITSPDDELITNQNPITLNWTVDGEKFSEEITLMEGENVLTKEVTDEAGNVGSDSITVILDTTPPVRSDGLPTGVLPAGTTQATLSLTTDEDAICHYAVDADTEYSEMTGIFGTTGEKDHSTLITGLADGNSYTYYVRCQDRLGNTNGNDYAISFSIDSPPPTNSGGSGGGGSYTPSSQVANNVPLKITPFQKGTLNQNLNNKNKIKLEVPKGSVKSTTTFTANEGSLKEGDVPKDKIGAFLFNGLVFNIEAVDAGGNTVREFLEDLTITLTVPDLPDDTSTLELYYYDDEKEEWIIITGVEFGKNTITFKVNHLTRFALFETNAVKEGEVKGIADVDIIDGDIIQCKTSDNPFAVYIVKIVGDTKYIRHIVSVEIFNHYGHLKWENLKQVDSLDNYSLSSWVRVNTGSNGTATPTDRVYEINGDQTKHWVNMTAKQFLSHGGSETAIYSVNQEELDLYVAGPDVMML